MDAKEQGPDRAVTWGQLVDAEKVGTLGRDRQGISQGKDYPEKDAGRGFQENSPVIPKLSVYSTLFIQYISQLNSTLGDLNIVH